MPCNPAEVYALTILKPVIFALMEPYQEAQAYLTEQFSLPLEPGTQDWELKAADPERVGEFIRFLEQKRTELPASVKQLLMALILFSYDEYLSEEPEEEDQYWEDIEDLVDAEPDLYHNTLTYWAMWEDYRTKRDNPFAITPMVRHYLTTRERPREYVNR